MDPQSLAENKFSILWQQILFLYLNAQ